MTSGTRMLLQFHDIGATTSWDEVPRERGRPARTIAGTASVVSSTRVDRQRRHGSGSGESIPLPPTGWPGAVSQGTERHATGVHAGGTPALPGGASSNRSCSSRGHAPTCWAAAQPMRQSRHAWWPFVILRVTSWMTLLSFVAVK